MRRPALLAHTPPPSQNDARNTNETASQNGVRSTRQHYHRSSQQQHLTHGRHTVRPRHRKLAHQLLRRKNQGRGRTAAAESHHLHGTQPAEKGLLQHQTRTKTQQAQVHSRHAQRQTLLHGDTRRCLLRTRKPAQRGSLHLQRIAHRIHPRTPASTPGDGQWGAQGGAQGLRSSSSMETPAAMHPVPSATSYALPDAADRSPKTSPSHSRPEESSYAPTPGASADHSC